MLRHIDLFTGIGGFTLALQNISRPVAYCDKSPWAQHVIQANIRRGSLADAPIYHDIPDMLRHKTQWGAQRPQLLTAGFPCVDISVANVRGQGLNGNVSGPLFSEILRVIDALGSSIQCVFLENSSAIVNRGLDHLVREFERRGFRVEWVILQATDVGAYHRRKRWFCLCWRKRAGRNMRMFSPQDIFDAYDWEKIHTLPRIIARKDAHHFITRKRLMLLGNALVPQCVMLAWNVLCKRVVGESYAYEKKKKRLHLHVTDGRSSFTKHLWATPTHHTWCIFDRITSPRCQTLLPIQIYYEVNTRSGGASKRQESKAYDIHPEFVEALMGFPLGWTLSE